MIWYGARARVTQVAFVLAPTSYSVNGGHADRSLICTPRGTSGATDHMRLSGTRLTIGATHSLPEPDSVRHGSRRYAEAAVHSSLRFQSSAASSGVATRLGVRSAHLS